jgi:hypothetical protein
MLKRLLVLFACLLPHLAIASPVGYPEKFVLTSLNISLTWGSYELGRGYQGTYKRGDWYYTLFFEVRDNGENRLWVSGEQVWGDTISFRYVATGDGTDGFHLYEDELGYPFSEVTDPFSESDFLDPVWKHF